MQTGVKKGRDRDEIYEYDSPSSRPPESKRMDPILTYVPSPASPESTNSALGRVRQGQRPGNASRKRSSEVQLGMAQAPGQRMTLAMRARP